MSFILTVSNSGNSTYEMENIVQKREMFYIINSMDDMINNINERYNTKEDKTIVIKIIKIDSCDQLTIQLCFDSVNPGLSIKKSNPTKSLCYNSDVNNFVRIKELTLVTDIEKYLKCNKLVNGFFS